MECFKRILYRILFPGPVAVIFSVPAAAALLICTFVYGEEQSPIAYASYAISAYSLIILCAYIVRFPKGEFRAALHRNPHIHRYLTDILFKTHVSLYLSLGLNMLFAAMKFFFGILYRSVWFGTLAVYYTMLAVMRFLLLRHVSRAGIGSDLVSELKQYRLCWYPCCRLKQQC